MQGNESRHRPYTLYKNLPQNGIQISDVKHKSIKLLEDNIGEYLNDCRSDNDPSR